VPPLPHFADPSLRLGNQAHAQLGRIEAALDALLHDAIGGEAIAGNERFDETFLQVLDRTRIAQRLLTFFSGMPPRPSKKTIVDTHLQADNYRCHVEGGMNTFIT
jgi:hypothetical protein